MMERTEILSTMGALKLFGMKAGYDEIVGAAVKRQHEPRAGSSATCWPPSSRRSRPARSSTR